MLSQQLTDFFKEKKYELIVKNCLEDIHQLEENKIVDFECAHFIFSSIVNAGYYIKGIELIIKYLNKKIDIDECFHFKLLFLLTESYFNTYNYSEGRKVLELIKQQLDNFTQTDDYDYFSCLYELFQGTIIRLPENFKQTEQLIFTKLEKLIEKGNKEHLAHSYYRRAIFYRANRKTENMFSDFEKAIKIYEEIKNNYGIAVVLFHLAYSYLIFDQYEKSQLNFDKSSLIFQELGNINLCCHSLSYVGVNYYKKNDLQSARNVLIRSLENIPKLFSNDYIEMDIKENLAQVFQVGGELEKSLEYFLETEKFFRKGNLKRLGGVLNEIGHVKSSQGKFEESLKYHKEAVDIFISTNDLLGIPWSGYYLGECKFEMGDFDGALDIWQTSFKQFSDLQNYHGMGITQLSIGKVYLVLNDKRSFEYYQKASAIFEKSDNLENLVESHIGYGIILEEQNRDQEAKAVLNKARIIMNDIESKPPSLGDKIYSYCLLSLENSFGKGTFLFSFILAYFIRCPDSIKNRQRIKFLTAVKLYLTPRLREKTKALELFESITKQEIIDYYTTLLSYLYILEIIIFELKVFKNLEILKDANRILEEITKLTSVNNVSSWAIRALALKAQIKLIELKFDDAKKLLNEALHIAVSKSMNRLAFQLSNQYDDMVSQIVKLDELRSTKDLDHALSDILEITNLSIFDANRNKFNLEIPLEEPSYLSFITTSGVTIFSVNFNPSASEKTDFDQLISGFLIALNSVILKLFSSTGFIERIKHKEYTITLISLAEPIYICYAYKGSSYHAQIKITNLKEELLEHPFFQSILDASTQKRTLNRAETVIVGNILSKYFTNYLIS